MTEIWFRGKRKDNGEWVEGYFGVFKDVPQIFVPFTAEQEKQNEGHIFSAVGGLWHTVELKTIGQFTGLYDKNGSRIFVGDILEFNDTDGIWRAPVVFERGLFGLDVYHVRQIENPKDWSVPYDVVRTRRWGYKWGYEEYGTAFVSREPLARATVFRGKPEEYPDSEHAKWHETHGYGKYRVDAEKIGNIHDNSELVNLEECNDGNL